MWVKWIVCVVTAVNNLVLHQLRSSAIRGPSDAASTVVPPAIASARCCRAAEAASPPPPPPNRRRAPLCRHGSTTPPLSPLTRATLPSRTTAASSSICVPSLDWGLGCLPWRKDFWVLSCVVHSKRKCATICIIKSIYCSKMTRLSQKIVFCMLTTYLLKINRSKVE